MYVKFPKHRWPEIKKAEENTSEGKKIYQELKSEFEFLFFNEKDENFEASALEQQLKSPIN